MQKELSAYLTGLANMALVISEGLSYSYIEITCFKNKQFNDIFSNYYKINKEDIELSQTKKTMLKMLNNWIVNEEIVKKLNDLIKRTLGDEIAIYIPQKASKLKDTLSGYNGGLSGFYYLEDIYFIKFDQFTACFLLGNNE